MRLRAGVVRGANPATYAAEGPTEGGGGSMRVVLNAGLTTTTARTHGSTLGRHRRHMLPSLDEIHDSGLMFFRVGGGGRGQ
jgi:hypothetical protein